MNSLLFERSSGSLGPNAFARIQTTALLTRFAAAPRLRFDGGERAASDTATPAQSSRDAGRVDVESRPSLWAHQAGVGSHALERFDGRMWASPKPNIQTQF